MKKIEVQFNGKNYTFRTNDTGDYLFTGTASNYQISHDTGFQSLRKIKGEIRRHLHYHYLLGNQPGSKPPLIKFFPSPSDWKP